MAARVDLSETLLEAPGYREFLIAAFRRLKKEDQTFSYASFVRKAGFSSRSFPRDVALGRKSLSLISAKAFSVAFGFNLDLTNYFLLLVQREEVSERDPKMTEAAINDRLLRQKKRISQMSVRRTRAAPSATFEVCDWLKIYAGSGSLESGSSIDEIQTRTGLPLVDLKRHLCSMNERGILKIVGGRYFPLEIHHVFEAGGGDELFRSWYRRSLNETRQKADAEFTSRNHLYYASVFSVKVDRMPEFKEQLRDLAQRFVENSESNHGEKLAKLVIGFYDV